MSSTASDQPNKTALASNEQAGSPLSLPVAPPAEADSESPTDCEPFVSPSVEQNEVSIAQYMESLLKRVNQLATGDGEKKEAKESTVEQVNMSLELSETPERDTTRRLLPKESHDDMAALRDVANEMSRDAIGTHSQQQAISAASGKLFATMVASVMAVLLLELSSPDRLLLCVGAAVSVVFAMFFALRYLSLTRAMPRSFRPTSQDDSPEAIDRMPATRQSDAD